MGALHPKFRLPLWAVLLLPAAAYVYRSVSRGNDFRPDLPSDAIALAVFAIGLAAVAWSHRTASKERDEQAANEEDGEDDGSRNERKCDDVMRDV